jgi:(2Fe-2S) ferredoxin
MPAFEHHIFVCGNDKCDRHGDGELRSCFKKEIKRRGLKGKVRANEAGCLDQCELGPTVVIYPQGIWYGRVTPDDVPRIMDETIEQGRVLADLVIPDELLNSGRGWPKA